MWTQINRGQVGKFSLAMVKACMDVNSQDWQFPVWVVDSWELHRSWTEASRLPIPIAPILPAVASFSIVRNPHARHMLPLCRCPIITPPPICLLLLDSDTTVSRHQWYRQSTREQLSHALIIIRPAMQTDLGNRWWCRRWRWQQRPPTFFYGLSQVLFVLFMACDEAYSGDIFFLCGIVSW